MSKPSRAAGALALVALTLAGLAALWLVHRNELGLTGFEIVMGRRPNMALLRANAQVAADSFLRQHNGELAVSSDGPSELTVDLSKSRCVRSRGYRASFYYDCWDVYLPYTLQIQGGGSNTVVVHLSDGAQGSRHEPQRFHVIDVRILDQQGRITKLINGT